MLRKVLRGEKRDWNTVSLYVLFAYQEVSQATVGFSPFKLLYGRNVRGPLDVLQEEWIQNQEAETDILPYVTNIRDRMEEAKEVVKENARRAQVKQKEYYDQELNLKPGDKVLLLPSHTKKFVAQWQGPYKIT